MIITLTPGADRQTVQQALAERGLWVGSVEYGPQAVHLIVAGHSMRADPLELVSIAGISDVSVPTSGHPRLDAQGPVVVVAGVPSPC
jgi:hypothetical protein